MKMTTLCYLEFQGSYLMLLRNKKKQDINEGKWIGIGGKFEDGETPEECVRREILEESGIKPEKLCFRGIIVFKQDDYESEYMYLFTGQVDSPEFICCNEGELHWVPRNRIEDLNLWEGDMKFLRLLNEDSPFFFMVLRYEGDRLVSSDVSYPTIKS